MRQTPAVVQQIRLGVKPRGGVSKPDGQCDQEADGANEPAGVAGRCNVVWQRLQERLKLERDWCNVRIYMEYPPTHPRTGLRLSVQVGTEVALFLLTSSLFSCYCLAVASPELHFLQVSAFRVSREMLYSVSLCIRNAQNAHKC